MTRGKIKWFNEDKGYGFIAIPDARDVFLHRNGITDKHYIPEEGDDVNFEIEQGRKGPQASNLTPLPPPKTSKIPRTSKTSFFPYSFIQRETGERDEPAFHDCLLKSRFDIAFEVVWTTKTPTALTPCEAPGVDPSATETKNENVNYNKRWLQFDNRLAISPFTVKGAIANGVANLLGGCYRIVDEEVGHKENAKADGFPYTGTWKRYRVSKNRSYPGLVRKIDFASGEVEVEAVTEYFLDVGSIPSGWTQGQHCQATWTRSDDGHKRIIDPRSLEEITSKNPLKEKEGKIELYYHSAYRFGVDGKLEPGDMGKKHQHRFYTSTKKILTGKLPQLNLVSQEQMLQKSYGGVYCKDNDKLFNRTGNTKKNLKGQPWYQDLRKLKPGDWCYYTTFKDETGEELVAGIGKNYQFKTFFSKQDAVSEIQQPCRHLDALCPRCRLFGVASNEDLLDDGKFAGRFRAASLVADIADAIEKVAEFQQEIPAENSGDQEKIIKLTVWENSHGELLRQFLLPVEGIPKDSNRDSGTYYNSDTGFIRGAKSYEHFKLTFSDLEQRIEEVIAAANTPNNKYAHRMRPIAPVCREGLNFKGTLGAENCSTREIAALLLLLDTRIADSAFKIGHAKWLGLGSVVSRIEKIWLRNAEEYQWRSVDTSAKDFPVDFWENLGLSGEIGKNIAEIMGEEELRVKISRWGERKEATAYPAPQKYRNVKVKTR